MAGYSSAFSNPLFPIETSTWKTSDRFLVDARLIGCQEVYGATSYPEGARELEIALWNSAVEKKKAALEAEGRLELKVGDIDGRLALYARNPGDPAYKQAMVPGFQQRYVGYDPRGPTLFTETVIYSEIEALKNAEYRKLFADAGLPLPIGPIAPVLIVCTADGYIACSKRGTATNKYPGAIWGFGGDIDNPNLTVGSHLEKVERKEELSSFRGIAPQYLALGIVYDKVLNKHDMPVFAQYPVPFAMMRKGDLFLPDVESIVPVSVRAADLEDYVADNYIDTLKADDPSWVDHPSAPWSADLFLAGKFLYGDAWAGRLLSRINRAEIPVHEPASR